MLNNRMKVPISRFFFIMCISSLIFILPKDVFSQLVITRNDTLVSGYLNKISGDDYSYHSSIPTVTESLIVRSTDGKYKMEWETDTVTEKSNAKFITFVWLTGIGSSPGYSEMTLTFDKKKHFVFKTDGADDFKIDLTDGSQLSFSADLTDQYGDKFGFMGLRIPLTDEMKGKKSRIEVVGGKFDLTSWYMTFKTMVRPGCKLDILPAILKENGHQLVSGSFINFGFPDTLSIYDGSSIIYKQFLHFGYNLLNFNIMATDKAIDKTLDLSLGSFKERIYLKQNPVRHWQIGLLQHSHTDIGYTRSQSEILAEHLRFIDYALDYCDATDSYPLNAQFRWTCESSWAVEEYLKTRPQSQIERLKKRVNEGRIELTAMYFNFDELPDEQLLAASLEPLRTFKQFGLPCMTAMQNDVNGIAWCMNDFYNELGVKYLNMGTHGHRALTCFEKPTLFWWESPSGKRILTFRAEHYMLGNTLLQIDKGDIELFGQNLLNYLTNLESKGYEYDEMTIQHSGYLTDNSPPSIVSSEIVRKWNKIFEWPKLSTSTTSGFFETMEEKYSDEFPVYRAAWPDWWTDGFGASAREVGVSRKAQAELTVSLTGMAMAKIMGSGLPVNLIEKSDLINNSLLFYDEHTVGYSESVREPYHIQTMEQRAIKESYAWEALRRTKMLQEETLGLLQSFIKPKKLPSLLVFNTLSWEREGVVEVYIDNQIIPRGFQPRFRDMLGVEYPAQLISSRSDGTYWAIGVKGIPEFGYKVLTIDKGEYMNKIIQVQVDTVLENDWYKLTLDHQKSSIRSWYDKDLEMELIDSNAKYQLGEFIYERLGNRYQMEQRRLDDFTRNTLDSARVETIKKGPVWNSIVMKGKTDASIEGYNLSIEVRLYNQVKQVDIKYSLIKKPVIEPEGIYVSFPFLIANPKFIVDVAGGSMEAGNDQIPGSSNDWNTFQHFVAVKNDSIQIVYSSKEVPLVQLGNINTGRYKAGAIPESSQLFSWPMNNYWVTNFNADQKGEHQWTYHLTSGNASNIDANRFGWNNRVPMLTRVLPGSDIDDNNWGSSLINNWPDNLICLSIIPGALKNEILFQVREINKQKADLTKLKIKGIKSVDIVRANAIGDELPQLSNVLLPLECGFFKIKWK
ncbi:MAG TPA: glycoside hydrolase family 38 C-terminal domain-containing protein [Lentimicrobium sp.]|nr:glycoside hydrolase family 38 C-terminal domain-containing protein [Lentimicrobium sp.]